MSSLGNILEGAILLAAGAVLCYLLLWWKERSLKKAKALETETSLEKTLYAVDELSSFVIAVALVRPTKNIADVDVADDLTRLAAELRLAPTRAPRTAQWLKDWELAASHLRAGTGKL